MARIGVMKRMCLSCMIMALNFTLLAGQSDWKYLDDDTVRADPLDNLKKYRGGYDITNVHYWSSTAFTGIYGYAIAGIWLVCGIGYAAFVVAKKCCMKRSNKLKKRRPCHNIKCYLHPLVLGLVLTLLAIMGCGLVLGGNAKFHSKANTVIDVIIDTVDEASQTIYTTTAAMRDMTTRLTDMGEPQATRFLTSTSQRLDSQADDIARQASKNRRRIDKGLTIVYAVTTTTISLTLVAVIALLVLGVLKFQRTIQVLVAVCWTFTVLCWLFFGIYFFLQNFSEDTCRAIESFQKDPYNSSLSSILPCDELVSAKSVLSDVSEGIYNLVDDVNINISQQYGNIIQICNPFSPPPLLRFDPSACPSTSIQIGDIPRVMRQLVCPASEGETCQGGIVVPADDYNRTEAYSTSIQKLLDVYPGMESLVECQTVKDAFSEILDKHCTPLKSHARMVWASLVFLSIVMVALVVAWTIGAHHDVNHHSFGGSVKPHSPAVDMLEDEKEADNIGDV